MGFSKYMFFGKKSNVELNVLDKALGTVKTVLFKTLYNEILDDSNLSYGDHMAIV